MEQGEGRERSASQGKRRLTTDVSDASIQVIARLKAEWGLRSRGAVLDRLLSDLLARNQADQDSLEIDSGNLLQQDANAFVPHDLQAAVPSATGESGPEPASAASETTGETGPSAPLRVPSETPPPPASEPDPAALFNETGALVLVEREGSLEASLDFDQPEHRQPSRPRHRPAGIELPGFVQRNSAQLRRSLNPPARVDSSHGDVLPALADPDLELALKTAAEHWFSLYGQSANEAVVEASMVWLARDIWTQSDQSEGEAFTWTLAQRLIAPCAPSWIEGPPTLERVIVLAGLLEDPFSASTLSLRIPTLIRRFVHRFRRRRNAASFQTLEHTMTLHGALKLLQIPIDSGQRLTLPLIREAYREMAMNHHPDAGGSVEMMRRLNEAYQLLKELYRNKEGAAPSL